MQTSALPLGYAAVSSVYYYTKKGRDMLSFVFVQVAYACEDGRRQKAESRREEYERGFDPAQLLATKSNACLCDK